MFCTANMNLSCRNNIHLTKCYEKNWGQSKCICNLEHLLLAQRCFKQLENRDIMALTYIWIDDNDNTNEV